MVKNNDRIVKGKETEGEIGIIPALGGKFLDEVFQVVGEVSHGTSQKGREVGRGEKPVFGKEGLQDIKGISRDGLDAVASNNLVALPVVLEDEEGVVTEK